MSSPLQQLRQHGIEIRHYIPGRLRFTVRGLQSSSALRTQIASDLGRVPGVKSVEIHPVSASVLVLFDPQQLAVPANGQLLLACLQRLFPTVGAEVWDGLWTRALSNPL